jgi:hypothetical protein
MTSSGAGSALGADGQPAKSDVGPALPDRREILVERGVHPDEFHVIAGCCPQCRGGRDREGIRQPWRHGHVQALPSQASCLPSPVHLLIHKRQHGAGCVEQHGAGRRESEPFTAALQQRRADDLFQPPDLLAQGGLGDEHLLRRPGEAARVDERREVPQMPQFKTLRRRCIRST